MSIKLISKAFDLKTNDALTKLILVKLADNSNDDGWCFPSYSKIAEQCETSKSTVIRKIKQLEKENKISIKRRKGEKGNSSNMFFLRCLVVADCHHPSSTVTPPIVADCHHPSSTVTPPIVADCHHPSSTVTPITVNEPSIITVNETIASKPQKQISKSKRSQISDTFEPNENNYSVAKQQNANISEQLPQFIDYHKAKGSLMADWNRAFNTWLRNANKFKPKNNSYAGMAADDTSWGDDLYNEFGF